MAERARHMEGGGAAHPGKDPKNQQGDAKLPEDVGGREAGRKVQEDGQDGEAAQQRLDKGN